MNSDLTPHGKIVNLSNDKSICKIKSCVALGKPLILFVTLLFNGLIGWSQAPKLPTIVPASPESSAIAKYLNFPISYSTGVPEISIPIYEIKVGDITLPISLSYHSSGLKVNEPISWAGSGWTLNAEPSVTRSIQGHPDEFSPGYLFSTPYPGNDNLYYIKLANGIY